jgi:hypothetical protein
MMIPNLVCRGRRKRFYAATKGPHEMGWERYQEGEFHSRFGRELWGDKAADVREGNRDAAKLDMVFFFRMCVCMPPAACQGAKLSRSCLTSFCT